MTERPSPQVGLIAVTSSFYPSSVQVDARTLEKDTMSSYVKGEWYACMTADGICRMKFSRSDSTTMYHSDHETGTGHLKTWVNEYFVDADGVESSVPRDAVGSAQSLVDSGW